MGSNQWNSKNSNASAFTQTHFKFNSRTYWLPQFLYPRQSVLNYQLLSWQCFYKSRCFLVKLWGIQKRKKEELYVSIFCLHFFLKMYLLTWKYVFKTATGWHDFTVFALWTETLTAGVGPVLLVVMKGNILTLIVSDCSCPRNKTNDAPAKENKREQRTGPTHIGPYGIPSKVCLKLNLWLSQKPKTM